MSEEYFKWLVAEGGAYDSEYDGRVYTYCVYCHSDMNDSEHDEDCDMIKARKELGVKWDDHIKEIGRKERAAYLKSPEYLNRKIPCKFCGKVISKFNMKGHQKTNKKCLKKQVTLE